MATIPWLGDVLRAAGIRVVEEGNWRGRYVSGSFNPIGVLWHHTAARSSASNPAPALGTVINGRPDLQGPLCHALVDYYGVFHLISAGRANHAGACRGSGPIPAGDGNTMLIGWEIDYDGVEQRMTAAQYNASVAATAAVLGHLGRNANYARGHRETSTTGKIDPSFVDLNAMRADVAAWSPGIRAYKVGSSVVVQGGVTKVYAGGTEVGSPLLQRVFRPGEGWLPWLNLGGGVVGRSSAVVYEDHLHVFVRGVAAPHRLMQRIYRPGGDWSDWIDHGGALGSDPVAVVERDNLYVFAAGSGSGRPLVQRAHSPGEGWNWIPLGGGLAGPPTVTVYRGELHIFARSTNGQHSLVQRVYNTGRGWGPWIDLGGSLSSDPAALVEGVRVRVFAASNDAARTLSQHVYDPDLGWRLTNLGGGVAGRPAAVTYDGYDHVFVRNPAGGLDQRILRPAGDWSGWVSHGAAIVSDPAAAVERDNLMVFAVGTADTMQLRVHNPDSHTWQWIDLGGPIHP
jgi:hypothetical protein